MADAKGGNFGTLSWGMGLDTKDFKKKMKDIRKNTKTFGKNMSLSFLKIGGAFAAVGIAAGAAGAAILLFTKNSLEATNAQILLADSIGVTQGDIAALELSATKFGVSQDMLIDKMREFGGLDEFNKIAEQVKNAGDETAQLAMAQSLLGNEGLKLLPILQQGSDGFAAMKREASELGLALSPVQIEESRVAWEQYEDTILNLKGLGTQLAQAFLKPLGLISAAAEGFIKTFKTDLITGFKFVSKGMENLIMGAINIFIKFGIPFINSFISFAGQIGGAFQTLFDFLSPATNSAIGGLVSMFNSVTDFIATFKQSLIIGITKPIQSVVRGAFGLLQKLFLGMRDMLAPILFGLVEVGAISDKTAQGLVNQFGDLATELHLQGIKIAKPFADAQKQAEKDMERILTDKYKKDQKQQTRFKGIIGEFTTNFGKALDNAAKVPAKVVAAALEASVSEKFSGLALSGSQEEASLKNTSKNRERFEKDNIKQLIDLNRNFEKLEAI
jgi:hypothetical protein